MMPETADDFRGAPGDAQLLQSAYPVVYSLRHVPLSWPTHHPTTGRRS